MRRKILHIFTITLISTIFVEASALAQEGEDLPGKHESTVLEKDSLRIEEGNAGELKNELMAPIRITPKDPKPTGEERENGPSKPTTIKKPASTAGEKAKEQENSSSLSFNFVHYLFYKFKVGSTSS